MPNRINHNLAINSANQNVQQTHLLTKANEKHDAIQSASESTNTKLDTLSGAINNNIGDAQVKLQTYIYGYDSPNGLARPLAVTANGELKVSNDVLEVSAETVNLNTDTLEAKIQATNDKIDGLSGAGNNNIGEGQSKLQTYLYGRDVSGGVFRPLVCDGDAHLQVDVLSSAAPAGSATEATLSAAEVHLGNIETAVQLCDDVVTAQNAAHPSKANAVGGRYYVDNTFRDIRVDNIGKVIIDTPSGSDLHNACDGTRKALFTDPAGTGLTVGENASAINTNIIAQNGKVDTTNSRLGTINTSLTTIDTTLGTVVNQFRGQTQDGNGGGNKLGVMVDAINTNTITQNGKIDTGNASLSSIDGKITACNTGAIAGSVTANAGTNLNTSALALESGGNLATIAGTVGFSKVNVNISSDAAGLATQVTAAAIAGDTTSIDGKITACNTGAVVVSSSALPTGAATESTLSTLNGKVTACNTGAIAGSVTANAGTNLNTSALALESGGNLATIAGDTTSIDGKITQGYDATVSSGGSGLQQVLLYGRDNSGNLDAIKVTANGDVDVEIADFVKGQTTMSASFPVTIASNQSSLTVQDVKTYGTLTTVDAALTVGGSSNADSSIVNNTDYLAIYHLQIVCSDAAYTSWTADILQSIDSSNYHITQDDINQGPSGPGSKLLTIVQQPAAHWKVNIQNTGGVSKNYAIKYIKA